MLIMKEFDNIWDLEERRLEELVWGWSRKRIIKEWAQEELKPGRE